jgi:hypothetical protein
MRSLLLALLVTLCAVPGCSKRAVTAPPSTASGETSKTGEFLAYQHTIRIRVPSGEVPKRTAAVREACTASRFGTCSLLSMEESGGNYQQGNITVRIVPEGVEPLAQMAAKDAVVTSRETSAEDLADVVDDTQQRLATLARQREKFEALEKRPNLAVSDQLMLSKELASLEVQTEAATRTSEQQRRRIETNRVAFVFAEVEVSSRSARIAEAFSGFWDSLLEGVAEALDYLGQSIPFLVLAFPLGLIWRWLWRRFTR